MQRQKLPQNLMAEKLMLLMPNAKFSVRPATEDENVLRAVNNPVIRGDTLIDWHPDNGECPTLEAIDAINAEQINAKQESDRKASRNKQYQKDLGVKAAYRMEKKANPALTFSEFLDELERD